MLSTFQATSQSGYQLEFFALSPLEDNTTQNIDKDITFVMFLLESFSRFVSSVSVLIGDSCNVNRAMRYRLMMFSTGMCRTYISTRGLQ